MSTFPIVFVSGAKNGRVPIEEVRNQEKKHPDGPGGEK